MGGGSSVAVHDCIEKKHGDHAFKTGNYLEAILWYSLPLSLYEINQENKQIMIILLSNRSVAYCMNGQYHLALSDAERVIELDPLWAKGYFRAAKVLAFQYAPNLSLLILQASEGCLRTNAAYYYYQRAKALSAQDQVIDDALSRIQPDLKSSQGSVLTWGSGESCGLGHSDRRDKHSPTMVDGLRGKHLLDISCGAMHSVAVTGTGEVYSWGQNKYGQVGVGGQVNDDEYDEDKPLHVIVPRLLSSLFGVFISAVSCGAGHSIAMAADGRVFSWGMGGFGQLGHGNLENLTRPTPIAFLKHHRVTAVSCGLAHSLFLLCAHGDTGQPCGQVMGCGMNTHGALGFQSTTESVATPSLIPLPSQFSGSVSFISCGGAHSAIIDEQGQLYLTGSNTCGQIGLNNQTDSITHFTLIETVHTNRRQLMTAPSFVYVACGEEFTAAITSTHQVYLTGLGIAGQMGNGTRENNLIFTHLESVDSHHIEEICCSQGIVYAVTSAGVVWSWGRPGDEISSDLHPLASSEGQEYLTPQLYGPLTSRKKAIRMVRCGRKHYTAITIIPYAPTSFIVEYSRDDSMNEKESFLNQHRRERIGKKLKVTLQCCDITGAEVRTSGCIAIGFLTKIESDQQSGQHDDGKRGDLEIPLFIDDNFDGSITISSESRLTISGEYQLTLMIDELHIRGSPFQILIPAGIVSKLHCHLLSNHFEESLSTSEDEDQRYFDPNQSINIQIGFTDEYGNNTPHFGESDEPCELKIKIVNMTNVTVLEKSLKFLRAVLETNHSIQAEVTTPAQYGSYSCHLFLRGSHLEEEYFAEMTDPILIFLKEPTFASATARCHVTYPPHLCVDQEIILTLTWTDTPSYSPTISSILTPQQSYLSARALIQLYTWNQNPCHPIHGVVTRKVSISTEQSIHIYHKVRISGKAQVHISVDNQEAHTIELFIHPGVVSPLFTELINPRVALSRWEENETNRLLTFQLRDLYGNLCEEESHLSPDTTMEFFAEEWIGSDESHKINLSLSSLSECVIGVDAVVYNSDRVSEYWIDVGLVNLSTGERTSFQYSPYCLGAVQVIETVITPLPNEKTQEDMSSSAPSEEEIKLKLENLQRLERTKKRAADALRMKQRLLLEERERNRVKKAARRTGGGFIVQYSKDI
jgi:alpha-tubulin suppressor-like RCC1 family protein